MISAAVRKAISARVPRSAASLTVRNATLQTSQLRSNLAFCREFSQKPQDDGEGGAEPAEEGEQPQRPNLFAQHNEAAAATHQQLNTPKQRGSFNRDQNQQRGQQQDQESEDELEEWRADRAKVQAERAQEAVNPYRSAKDLPERFLKKYAEKFYTPDSKRIPTPLHRNRSPEDDPKDPSIKWEDFTRNDMYKLLSHYEMSKDIGHQDYQDLYVENIITSNEHIIEAPFDNSGHHDEAKENDDDNQDPHAMTKAVPPPAAPVQEFEWTQEKEIAYKSQLDLEMTEVKEEQASRGSHWKFRNHPSDMLPEIEQKILSRMQENRPITQTGVTASKKHLFNPEPTRGEIAAGDDFDETLQHVQWLKPVSKWNRILNDSDDEAGDRYATAMDGRHRPDATPFHGGYKAFAEKLPASIREKHGDILQKMIEKDQENIAKEIKKSTTFNPVVNATEYTDIIPDDENFISSPDPTGRKDKLFQAAEVPYEYEDWHRALERQSLLRLFEMEEIPRPAAEALQKVYHRMDMHKYTVEPLIADSPDDPGDTDTVQQYQQRMIHTYGDQFEYRERHAFADLTALLPTLDHFAATAPTYVELDRRIIKSKKSAKDEVMAARNEINYDEAAENLVGLRNHFFWNDTDVFAFIEQRNKHLNKIDEVAEKLKKMQLEDSEADMTQSDSEHEPAEADVVDGKENSWTKTQFPDRLMYDFTDWNETYNDPEFVNTDYKHLDINEAEFRKNVDPIGDDLPNIQPLEFPEVYMIAEDIKTAIFKLNMVDPVKYHTRKLSSMFKLSVPRVKAILLLKYREWQISEESGLMEMFGADWAEALSRVTDDDTEGDYEEDFDEGRSVYSGQDLHSAMEEEFTPHNKLAQWDPPVPPIMLKNTDGRFVDEGDLFMLKALEKKKRARYWKGEDIKIQQEKARAAEGDKKPFGAPNVASHDATVLSTQVHEPSRYTVCMTDISCIKDAEYRIAVRDMNGTMREPTEYEFNWVRKREKHKKDFFRYRPYSGSDVPRTYILSLIHI